MSNYFRELTKLKSTVVNAIRKKMLDTGAIESYYNKITGGTGACENVPTAFILKNTKEVSFLSQTDQLSMEAEVLEFNIDAIWTLGRSYRNEPRTGDGRHLSEFALLEYECREMDLTELLKFQQTILDASMEVALECPIVPDSHKMQLRKWLRKPAPIVSYSDVLPKLNEAGFAIQWGDDFTSEIEHKVCEIYDGPVQITHYPESIKFFNMYRTDRSSLSPGMSIAEYNENKFTVACVDFILPKAGETFGASQREEDYQTLVVKLKESVMFHQMSQIRAEEVNNGEMSEDVKEGAFKPFVPYLELFNPEKHPDRKNVCRSGFGLGMGRLIQFVLGTDNVIVF